MVYDFHTHTLLSDGDLLPIELIRRAIVAGYEAIAITDHVSASNVERVVSETVRDCEIAEREWGITAIPGVEITHVPPNSIEEVVKLAKRAGAEIVVVHGETIVEPVERGTNMAALGCSIDVLAHPGLLSLEEATLAKDNEVFLEVTAKAGHSLTNGHVVAVGRKAGARFLINSDAHAPSDLLNGEKAKRIALGAGLTKEESAVVLEKNPEILLKRLGRL